MDLGSCGGFCGIFVCKSFALEDGCSFEFSVVSYVGSVGYSLDLESSRIASLLQKLLVTFVLKLPGLGISAEISSV